MTEEAGDLRLSLFEHLSELRQRLMRSVLAVLVLGTVSLAFAKELFHVLVLPVLKALPEGERALVQTSAVEELNTVIKVGLYAGLFFAAPVILGQVWGFVSPGLYPSERKMAAPFVMAGTSFFVLGAAFCYFVVLPPAFEFLLKPEAVHAQRVDLDLATGELEDVGRLVRTGDLAVAERRLERAEQALASLPGVGDADAAGLRARADSLDPVLDAADRAVARSGQGRDALVEAIGARADARAAAIRGDVATAADALARAERSARTAYEQALGGPEGARGLLLLERFETLRSRLVAAQRGVAVEDWTRPMLSMKEQLNLVLVMLLSFGVIFEIPVVFALLAALGVVTGEGLAKFRRYAIVLNVIVAAILTPTGDPLNLALMAVPMIVCYELGVLAARVITARRRARQAAAETA